ncbi:MAG TPA: hypothetical protein VFK05_16180 [Polyangiaceae bacterium]|nr:hypothetical protein [Polyangiaceae bacterium]
MPFRRASSVVFSGALLLGLVWGCAAADNSGDANPGSAGTGGITGPGHDPSSIEGDSPQGTGGLGQNPLCGKTMCVPDSAASCVIFTPPAASADAGPGDEPPLVDGQAGAQGEGGSGGDGAGIRTPAVAGEGGTRSVGEGGSAGEGGSSGALGEAGSAGAAGATAVPGTAKYGCQVQRIEPGSRTVLSQCSLAGVGGENAPCLTASDCQPGLGCVGDQNAGLCLPYCCQSAEDCARGSYCAPRPMRDATINESGASDKTALSIPVCVHADNCDLSVPYPCPKGSTCACGSGKACMVVRSDGTTTCTAPGAGKVGEACPCAWGYVCSAATNRCLELCSTRESGACGTGKCQSASELPLGWGVCVGLAASGG